MAKKKKKEIDFELESPLLNGSRKANTASANKKIVEKLAKKFGWVKVQDDSVNFTLGFVKNTTRIMVYYSKMTVGTALNHPTKGKTQLFRKCVDMELMEQIFKNPRTHTNLGYFQN